MAIRQMAGECDLVLVIGSRNSSNSVRLSRWPTITERPARLIDHEGQIDPACSRGST